MADVVAIDEESNLLCFGTVVERDFFSCLPPTKKRGKKYTRIEFFLPCISKLLPIRLLRR